MTLTLILTRHAKSSWGDPTTDDHDRRLNRRGQKAALAIGKWMKKHKYCPRLVLSSSARRTAETWAEIALSCTRDADVKFAQALYLASPDKMLKLLQKADRKTVMMLGHNPGTGALADMLLAKAPDHPKFQQYPTAATTVIEFDAPSWKKVTPGSGTLVDFVVPRDLT